MTLKEWHQNVGLKAQWRDIWKIPVMVEGLNTLIMHGIPRFSANRGADINAHALQESFNEGYFACIEMIEKMWQDVAQRKELGQPYEHAVQKFDQNLAKENQTLTEPKKFDF